KLRIAFTTHNPTDSLVHADCLTAWNDAKKLCADLGHIVEEKTPKYDGGMIMPAFLAIWAAGAAATIDALAMVTRREGTRDDGEPLSWALAEMGRQTPAGRYLMSVAYFQHVTRQIARFMQEWDVLVTPSLAEPPVPLGTFEPKNGDAMAGFMRAASFS